MTDVRPAHVYKTRNSWRTVRALLRKLKTSPTKAQRSSSIVIGAEKGSATTSEGSISSSAIEILPSIQKALVVAEKGKYEIRHDFPMPQVGEDEIMIRSHYVGLNPIDWKSVDFNFCLPQFPWVCS
jgi:hypothetical protein